MRKLIFIALLTVCAPITNQVSGTTIPQTKVVKTACQNSFLTECILRYVAAETGFNLRKLQWMYAHKTLTIRLIKKGSFWVSLGREGGGMLVVLSEINS